MGNSVFTINRMVIRYEPYELDTNAIRQEIPETVEHKEYYVPKGVVGDKEAYRYKNYTRPNPERIAAEAIEITGIEIWRPYSGEGCVYFIHNGKEYQYAASQEYDTGLWGKFYYVYPNVLGERIYDSRDVFFDITLPVIWLDMSEECGETCIAHIPEYRITMRDVETFLIMILASSVSVETECPYEYEEYP